MIQPFRSSTGLTRKSTLHVATELESFDGRKDPDRCSALINQLRSCQDRILCICHEITDEAIPDARADRDFRAKFPGDVLQEKMSGLLWLWFGAEYLAAGSNIINRFRELIALPSSSSSFDRTIRRKHALRIEFTINRSFATDNSFFPAR
ncbi:hypothetical protein HPB48_017864 [Haemaphysalis longicornis]|uniref:Uncharacterized protein n=1 Tax=Haemaphysalis longicornis TaxID=44386 RepID=A0A9J6GN55_HAELO|nr:hypothetical protein HPB48_017864 [Haemaphysalis longicornis]